MSVALILSLAALAISLSALVSSYRASDEPTPPANLASVWHSLLHRHHQRDMVSNHATRVIACPCGWSRRWGWRP